MGRPPGERCPRSGATGRCRSSRASPCSGRCYEIFNEPIDRQTLCATNETPACLRPETRQQPSPRWPRVMARAGHGGVRGACGRAPVSSDRTEHHLLSLTSLPSVPLALAGQANPGFEGFELLTCKSARKSTLTGIFQI